MPRKRSCTSRRRREILRGEWSGKEAVVRCLVQRTFLARAAWRASRCGWARQQPSHRQPFWPSKKKSCCACCTRSMSYRSIHRVYAGAQHPVEEDLIDNFSTPAKSAWRGRSCCWRATENKNNRPRAAEGFQATLRAWWNDAIAREFLHEQIQKTRFIEYNGKSR